MTRKNVIPCRFRLGLFVPTSETDYNKVQSAYWIRILQMKQHYQNLGVDVHINQPFLRYDIVIYFREMNLRDYWIIRLLRLISRKVYWDTVVDYFKIHEACNDRQVRSSRKIAKFVDGVICSTETIANSAQGINPNVIVMNDPINVDHFSSYKNVINWDNPTFIWSGISHKSSCLDYYREYLSERAVLVMENEIDREFKYEFIKWTYEGFPLNVMKGDIAFLPRVLNSPYNMGHSCFKALPFALAGIPIISNRIPSYVQMSKHYDAICFLEDYPDIFAALDELKTRSRNTSRVRVAYSCETIAKQFLLELEQQLKQ